MRPELREYLKEPHTALEIAIFIKELVDSPDAEEVYYAMAYAIKELAYDRNNTIGDLEIEGDN